MMADSFALLVLVILVAQRCGAIIFGRPTCGGELYDKHKAICCRGYLYEYERAEERANIACCKLQTYNKATHYCCLGRWFEYRVAAKSLGKSREEACANKWRPTYNL